MNSENINEEILSYFKDYFSANLRPGEPRRVLIWYDEDGTYAEFIAELTSDNLEVLIYNDNPMFIEHHIMNLEPGVNVLVYVGGQYPGRIAENPLIRLEMTNPDSIFVPDETTLNLKSLGLSYEYHKVVELNKRFFKNKGRVSKIKEFLPIIKTPEDLNYAFLAVNFDAESIREDKVLIAIFKSYMANPTEFFKELKYIDEDFLTTLLINYFGDKGIVLDDIEGLLEKVAISYFMFNLDGINIIPRLKDLVLPKTSAANVNMLVHDLINNAGTKELYRNFAEQTARKYNISEILNQLDLDAYIAADTFEMIDEAIIHKLLIKLDNNEPIAPEIKIRRTKNISEKYENDYKMLEYADKLIDAINRNLTSIIESNRDRLVKLYSEKLCQIDALYRKFNEAYTHATKNDDYMSLVQHVENIYVDEYNARLAEKWCNSISGIDWGEGKISLQQNFYDDNLRILDAKKDRVFVIISDAMRYEVATELMENLRKTGAEVTIEPMVGTIPSYTQLGMAALLPHGQLSVDDKETAFSDGSSTAGIENRNKLLQLANESNIAVQYSGLASKRKTDWKTLFSGKKYVYIYHNVIDNTGEHDSDRVFEACTRAISEIEQLIKDLHTTFSGVNVTVTSDHGFFYRRTDLIRIQDDAESDKTKNRYSLSETPGNPADSLSFKLSYILDDDRYVNIPRGDMTYSKRGATGNYCHGGAMPQEIIIPKLSFKSSRQTVDLPQVRILYNGISTKITNAITNLHFIQDEPVSNEKVGDRYKIYFVDEENNRISNEAIIIADSEAKELSEREYIEKFTFAAREYDKNANYYLVIEDEKNHEERINFKIDIMMSLI